LACRLGSMCGEDAQIFDRSRSAISIADVWEQLERRDARLSLVESSLKQVQRQVTTWSGIVQDGFADLSVQINFAMGRRHLDQCHLLDMRTEGDSQLSDRLSNLEQQAQAMQMKFPEMIAQTSQAKQQLEELQVSFDEMRSRFISSMQNSNDEVKMHVQVVKELCLRLERNHVLMAALPPNSSGGVENADPSALQGQKQNVATTKVAPKTALFGPLQQQRLVRHGEQVQHLRLHQLPQQVQKCRPLQRRDNLAAAERNRRCPAKGLQNLA